MIKSVREIKKRLANEKLVIADDYVDINFIIDLLDCKKAKAYLVLKQAREHMKSKSGFDCVKGRATLSSVYEILNLKGHFE